MTRKERLLRDAANIRKGILYGLKGVGAGHIGGSMSMVEIMAALYGGLMNVDPADPGNEARDRLVVSKGHCGPAVYATLALKGYFPYEELATINRGGTRLPSHCDMNRTPGIDMTTGSLGQGMSTSVGIALGTGYLRRDAYTWLILGDGELQEGQVWEGALFAAQHKLSKLIAFVDANGKQLDGYTDEICGLGDIAAKFSVFGWNALNCDGNDVESVYAAATLAKSEKTKPSVIVAHTEKGIGCSFAEDVYYNHHMSFSEDQWQEAMDRLDRELAQLGVNAQ
ncbi:MAG: transketolase [Clostridiales Family XIII bacterium]|nr:transketolase [Clostridiales Family XIII bacterium]